MMDGSVNVIAKYWSIFQVDGKRIGKNIDK